MVDNPDNLGHPTNGHAENPPMDPILEDAVPAGGAPSTPSANDTELPISSGASVSHDTSTSCSPPDVANSHQHEGTDPGQPSTSSSAQQPPERPATDKCQCGYGGCRGKKRVVVTSRPDGDMTLAELIKKLKYHGHEVVLGNLPGPPEPVHSFDSINEAYGLHATCGFCGADPANASTAPEESEHAGEREVEPPPGVSFPDLPDLAWVEVFSFLGTFERENVELVCQKWRDLSRVALKSVHRIEIDLAQFVRDGFLDAEEMRRYYSGYIPVDFFFCKAIQIETKSCH